MTEDAAAQDANPATNVGASTEAIPPKPGSTPSSLLWTATPQNGSKQAPGVGAGATGGAEGGTGPGEARALDARARGATERLPTYRRSDPARLLRADRRGWRGDLTLLMDDAALDAEERGIRVIFLVARNSDPEPARRLAASLGGRSFERADGEQGLGTVRVAEFLDAADAALAGDDSFEGPRVFIDTLFAATDCPIAAAARRSTGGLPEAGEEGLTEALAQRGIFLVLSVVARTGQSLLPLVDALPNAILVPWTDAWLAAALGSETLSNGETLRKLANELRATALVADPLSGETEALLDYLLHQPPASDEEEGDSRVAFEARVRRCIAESRTGKPRLSAAEKRFFLDIVQSDADAATGGAIGRTILLVALLVPNRPAMAILDFCRHLLPPGPAHTACLPPLVREQWLRDADNDRRLGRPTRDPPGWADFYDMVRDAVVQNIGLVIGSERILVPGPRLARLDIASCLAGQTGRLAELSGLVKSRVPATLLPPALLPVLTDLVTALHRLDRSYFELSDLVWLFAGMYAGDTDLGLPAGTADDLLPTLAPEMRAAIRTVGALPDGLDEGDLSRVEAATDALRDRAAAHVWRVLNVWTETPQVDDAMLGEFLSVLFARIPAESATTILAYVVLFGPRIAPPILGKATADLFAGLGREAFTDAFRTLRVVLSRTMRAAIDERDTDDGARIVRVDAWADALWAVAGQARFRLFGRSLAIWIDDALTTWEIPAGPRELLRPDDDPGIMARLAFSRGVDADERIGPDLLCRLFERTPAERLDALAQLSELAGGPRDANAPAIRLADQVAQRIRDIFWIMAEEIDKQEANGATLRGDQLETMVWETLARHYRLEGFKSTDEVIGAVYASHESPPERGGSDARVLLDLYAPATLMFWRFHRFGTAELAQGSADYAAFEAALRRIAAVTAPPERAERTRRAFGALVAVETALVGYFRSCGCPRTAGRHGERLKRWAAVASCFDTPARAGLPTSRG